MQSQKKQAGILSNYRDLTHRNKSLSLGLLLATLLVTILLTPTFSAKNSVGSPLFTLFLFLMLTITLRPICAGFPVIRKLLQTTGILVFALYTLTVFTGSSRIMMFATLTFSILFFLSMMLLLMMQLFSVETQLVKLLAALNFYLLTGISFSFLYLFINLINPVSFDLPGQNLTYWPEYLYFSFVTLTTLGYGDILPISEVARSLATLEAIIGTLSPTVMIARFVSTSH